MKQKHKEFILATFGPLFIIVPLLLVPDGYCVLSLLWLWVSWKFIKWFMSGCVYGHDEQG